MSHYVITNIDDLRLNIKLLSGDLIVINPGHTVTLCGESVAENVCYLGSLIDSGHIIIDVIVAEAPLKDFAWSKEGF